MSLIQPRKDFVVNYSKLTFLTDNHSNFFNAIRDLDKHYQEVCLCVEQVNYHYEKENFTEYFVFIHTIISGYEQASYAFIEAHKALKDYLASQGKKIDEAIFKERHEKYEKTLNEAKTLTKNQV